MIKRLLNVSLKTKIIGMVITIILSLIILLLSVFAYFDVKQVYSNKNTISLQTAKTISYIPDVARLLKHGEAYELQSMTTQFSVQNDADFIVIQNLDGTILTHPDVDRIGEHQPFDDGYMARVFGGYYNVESNEFIGPSVVGKAPVMDERENMVGVVSVGYLKEKINSTIFQRLKDIFYFSITIALIGVFASYLLARNIRKDTMGLEPREIATLYRDRASILSSINEGIIATDDSGNITLINESAKKLLHVSDDYMNKSIEQVLPDVDPSELMNHKEFFLNKEMLINNKVIVINMVPILSDGNLVGTVATFKDKTEITEMLDTLSEVKTYTDDLRAQTHEFSNKMYVISGLLQLKKYDEVLNMVKEEFAETGHTNKLIFEQIKDFKVQAVLLGKMSKASEKKIDFEVDNNSLVHNLPEHIKTSHIITIIGNLIDNAFDEVMKQSDRNVTFFALDIGHDIILEVSDNGSGLHEEDFDKLFAPGYSTKSNHSDDRGFGLFNVKEALNSLHGSIEIDSDDKGTTITVYIPKNKKGD
ncbi:sensor histidine kinase [Lentibacillus populi]|uniref:histidine kinase n=1 Tax=Lentibacillus populi TaxID=1827502 RepID=A0A9W5X6I8_9BACI|nr:sensor histidine kinase [Lentibacillus populi]GGB48715.1 sensor histidine kinase [Lentibacillus populi]